MPTTGRALLRSGLWLLLLGLLVLGAGVGVALSHGTSSDGFPDIRPKVHGDFRANAQWAGFAQKGEALSEVSASWTVPTARCSREDSNASFWVGLDGIGSETVEQAGVEALCRDGRPRYRAFYEFYPEPSVRPSWDVAPGDPVVARVVQERPGRFRVEVRVGEHDITVTRAVTASGRSAEVVVEQSGDRYAPLTPFGEVAFDDVSFGGHDLRAASAYRLAMLHRDGELRALPGPLSADGREFEVTFLRR